MKKVIPSITDESKKNNAICDLGWEHITQIQRPVVSALVILVDGVNCEDRHIEWDIGEPSNSNGIEDCLSIWTVPTGSTLSLGMPNDFPCELAGGNNGIICEVACMLLIVKLALKLK